MRAMLHGAVLGLVLGLVGALAGGAVLRALETLVAPLTVVGAGGAAEVASLGRALAYVVASGIVSLVVTFVPAVALRIPEVGMLSSITRRLKR